jgi:hypothetical protein
MKTPLIYGLLLAVAGTLLNFGLFFAGFHDTPEKLHSVQWVQGTFGLVATLVALVLAMRARRAEYPADQAWTYGSAFGAGELTAMWGILFGAIFSLIYFLVVNPQFSEVVYQMQVQQMELKNVPASAISQAEPIMRRMTSPYLMTAMNSVVGLFICTLLALIVAIFFRSRSAIESADTAIPPVA